ncbi:MAG: hypothetical protein WCJ33_07860, partial [Pseudomonadota bacterium]
MINIPILRIEVEAMKFQLKQAMDVHLDSIKKIIDKELNETNVYEKVMETLNKEGKNCFHSFIVQLIQENFAGKKGHAKYLVNGALDDFLEKFEQINDLSKSSKTISIQIASLHEIPSAYEKAIIAYKELLHDDDVWQGANIKLDKIRFEDNHKRTEYI